MSTSDETPPRGGQDRREGRPAGSALCSRCGDACPNDRLVLPDYPWCRSCFETVTAEPGLPGAHWRQSASQLALLGFWALVGGVVGALFGALVSLVAGTPPLLFAGDSAPGRTP